MATFKPSDFNRKAQFGTYESVKNEHTGAISKQFVPKVSLWYAPKTRTLHQQYQLIGTRLENTKVIVTRHHASTEGYTMVQIDDVKYDVSEYSPDESNSKITYDFITLKRRA